MHILNLNLRFFKTKIWHQKANAYLILKQIETYFDFTLPEERKPINEWEFGNLVCSYDLPTIIYNQGDTFFACDCSFKQLVRTQTNG